MVLVEGGSSSSKLADILAEEEDNVESYTKEQIVSFCLGVIIHGQDTSNVRQADTLERLGRQVDTSEKAHHPES